MGSISLNGTAYGESFVGGDFPAGPMSYAAWAKAGEGVGVDTGIIALETAGFTGRPSYNCRATHNPDIRRGLFNQDQLGVLSTVSLNPQHWAYYFIGSDGGSNDITWGVVRDAGGGVWTVEQQTATLAFLSMSSADLVFLFFGTIGGSTRIQDPMLMTAIKVYQRNLYTSGAGSGTDLIAQARTRTTLWPGDLYAAWNWDGTTISGLDVSDEGAHTMSLWDPTGVSTSTDQPSFPDDGVLQSNAAIIGAHF